MNAARYRANPTKWSGAKSHTCVYNRKLKRLVAIELKLGSFTAEYKRQMELYLRWLAKHEQEPDEVPPIGIILCARKKREQIELLELGKSGIHVAEHLTVLPPRETLQAKLHQSIAAARARLDDKRGAPYWVPLAFEYRQRSLTGHGETLELQSRVTEVGRRSDAEYQSTSYKANRSIFSTATAREDWL